MSFHRIDRLSSASGRPILLVFVLFSCVCVRVCLPKPGTANFALLDLTEDTEDEPELLNLVLELSVPLSHATECTLIRDLL